MTVRLTIAGELGMIKAPAQGIAVELACDLALLEHRHGARSLDND
jgi:hypothetical protein